MVTVTMIQPAVDALVASLDASHGRAAADTLARMRDRQAVVSGELRDSYHLVAAPLPASRRALRQMFIVSSAEHADAVEHGAWARRKGTVREGTRRRGIYETVNGKRKRVGWESGPLLVARTRRGPHMEGNHVVRDTGPEFLEHMSYRLRGGNYSGLGLR